MSTVLSEVINLSQKDCFYIVERHKSEFTYPLHRHREFELNFVQGGKGFGASWETALKRSGSWIWCSSELKPGTCMGTGRLQVRGHPRNHDPPAPDLVQSILLSKTQFARINRMMEKARHGLSFPPEAILKVYHFLDGVASEKDSFIQFINCLMILYSLSGFEGKTLASSSFSHAPRTRESSRLMKVKEYINTHYTEDLGLKELAGIVGMSPSALSRFFKEHTNKTLTAYINDIRLGNAARALVDSTQNISEICYSCGFNNLSNFNRVFKARRGVSPREFRQLYKKTKIIV